MTTIDEAAATLGISRAFAYEAVRRGEIPSIRIGRRILVPFAALNRLLFARSSLGRRVTTQAPCSAARRACVSECLGR